MKRWKPPAENLPNIIEKLVEGSFMPYFFQLINTTEYGEKLREMPATLFVPVEDTLDLMTPRSIETLEKAFKDEKLALQIIENHLLSQPMTLKEMLNLRQIETVNGNRLDINVQCHIREDFEFSISQACYVEAEINSIPMETANIVCYNGFIHTIRGIII